MSYAQSNLNHRLRVPLAAEVHSRPSLRLSAPETLTHFAVFAHAEADPHVDNSALQHKTLAALCLHFGVAAPHVDSKYFFHDFGRFRLQWECHTEFATYTFAEQQNGSGADSGGNGTAADKPGAVAPADGSVMAASDSLSAAFQQVPLRHIPQQWLERLQGTMMVAAHLVLRSAAGFNAIPLEKLRGFFDGKVLVGSNALQAAEVWTDFAIHADGFCRFVVQDVGLGYQQAGRLVQRVLEIETYRMMALMGLPYAQRATPLLNQIEGELAQLTAAMTRRGADAAPAGEGATGTGAHGAAGRHHHANSRAALDDALWLGADDAENLLHQILGLAARMEQLALENNYRFSASEAYFKLVQSRIESLRENRIDGAPTIVEFMDRRLAPAMSTCAATARRQHLLGERIANTNALLRTKVGIVQERQNRKILESLNTRAAHQLRLQQSVEGLSVVAISYYSVGLLSYIGKALKSLGLPLNPDLLTGALIPLVACAVWFGLRRLHKLAASRRA